VNGYQIAEAGCTGRRLIRVRGPGESTVSLSRLPASRPAEFAPAFEGRGSVPALAAGIPVRLRLRQGETAFFPFNPDPNRRYALRTINLAPQTDTILTLLGAAAESIMDNDDENEEEPLASRILLNEDVEVPVAAISVGTFNDVGGEFDLLLEDRGAAPPEVELVPGQPVEWRLDRDTQARFRAQLRAGARYVLATRELGPDVDTVLRYRSADGGARGENDDVRSGNLASRLELAVGQDGVYRIQVRNIGASGRFTLLLSEE